MAWLGRRLGAVGLAVIAASCHRDAPTPSPSCDDDTWESFAHGYTVTWCRSCHSSALTTPESRYGAPLGIDFDTLADVQDLADRVEGAMDRMPPAGGVPEDERARFEAWVQCGMVGVGTVIVPGCESAAPRAGDVAIGAAGDADALCAGGPITIDGSLTVGADAALGCVCGVSGDVVVSAGAADLPVLDAIGGDLVADPGAVQIVAPELHTLGGSLRATQVPALVALDVSSLESVGGDVLVLDAPALAEFLPERLDVVPGSLVVERTGVDAVDLSRIDSVGGDLRVVDDPELVDVRGEGYDLVSVGGDLLLTGLPNWSRTMGDEPGSFYGFAYLESVGGDLRIEGADAITVIRGFNYLTEVGGTVSISDDPALVATDGFDALRTVGGDLRLDGNAALAGNDGFDSLGIVGGELSLRDSPQLEQLGALSKLDAAGGLALEGLHALPSVPAFPNLTTVRGDLRLVDLPLAPAIDGFFSLATVEGDVVLEDLPALTTLNLRTVTLDAVDGDLRLARVGLTAIPLPASLVDVGGSLVVDDNPALTDVSGLFGLGSVGADLHVTGNLSLPAASAAALAVEIEAVGGTVTIEDNGP